jgi:hypothetical protein
MWLVLPVAAFLVAVLSNIVVARRSLMPMSSLMSFFVIGSVIGLCLVIGSLWMLDRWIEVVAAVSLYGLLCVLHMLALALVMASVSVFMILLIRERPQTPDEIDALYSRQKMLAARFDRVEAARLIEKQGEDYVITRRGRIMLATLIAMRRFFGHEART